MFRFAIGTLVLFVYLAFADGCSGLGKQMLRSGRISEYEKQMIVDSHNRLRQSVALGQVHRQPPASDMMEIQWDDELAETAQRWADNCLTAHDRASQREVARFPVGQNIAATWTTRPPSGTMDSYPDFSKQIHAWFNEVGSYGYKPMGYTHGTGHYSQLVWGETTHVGCGYSYYYDPSRGYTKLYVCNYGPGGNVIGEHPYKKGAPSCANYGLTDSSTYSGLCSSSYGLESFNAIPGSSMDFSMFDGDGSTFSSMSPLDTFNDMSGIFGLGSFYQPKKNGFKYSILGR